MQFLFSIKRSENRTMIDGRTKRILRIRIYLRESFEFINKIETVTYSKRKSPDYETGLFLKANINTTTLFFVLKEFV